MHSCYCHVAVVAVAYCSLSMIVVVVEYCCLPVTVMPTMEVTHVMMNVIVAAFLTNRSACMCDK
jgi:hypothetical protein